MEQDNGARGLIQQVDSPVKRHAPISLLDVGLSGKQIACKYNCPNLTRVGREIQNGDIVESGMMPPL